MDLPAVRLARRLAAAALLALLAGCSSLPGISGLWPFGARPAAVPQPVDELVFETADGGAAPAFPQYWKRNTLVVDLSSAPASGSVTLRPRAAEGWPVRVAFRVVPGTIGQLEVRALQRVLLPVNPAAGPPVDLELGPSVLARGTPRLVLSWGQSPPGA
ncbi:MAG: hypothetical protein MUF07_14240 [Steroidobacteraceae bacterium]|nr:hypothetical protein [Steroidobacteraceae bacterium]